MDNKVIGEETCPRCKGEGKLPVWLAPPPCKPDCVNNLSEYPQEVMYWLCFTHINPVPTLWRADERARCIAMLVEHASKNTG